MRRVSASKKRLDFRKSRRFQTEIAPAADRSSADVSIAAPLHPTRTSACSLRARSGPYAVDFQRGGHSCEGRESLMVVKAKAEAANSAASSGAATPSPLVQLLLLPLTLLNLVVVKPIMFVATLLLVKPMLWISTTRFRWIVVIPIVLPMSMAFNWFTLFRARVFFWLYGSSPAQAKKKHNAKVRCRPVASLSSSGLVAPGSRLQLRPRPPRPRLLLNIDSLSLPKSFLCILASSS